MGQDRRDRRRRTKVTLSGRSQRAAATQRRVLLTTDRCLAACSASAGAMWSTGQADEQGEQSDQVHERAKPRAARAGGAG